jgi:hypothetical protein
VEIQYNNKFGFDTWNRVQVICFHVAGNGKGFSISGEVCYIGMHPLLFNHIILAGYDLVLTELRSTEIQEDSNLVFVT